MNEAIFRLAVAQIAPRQGEVEHNIERIALRLEEAAGVGAQLVLFPECATSGYVFDSAEEARAFALPAQSARTAVLEDLCRRHNLYCILGLLEADTQTSALYNSALVLGPQGVVSVYRKCHLPVLGIDRYVGAGSALEVLDLPFARIGILICYDIRFPEAARSLAIQGADLLALPTNWPEGAESAPEFLTRARAWENRMFVAACNRVGVERGTCFIGRSQIVTPNGAFLAQADGNQETILYADIDVRQARQKKLVIKPGEFELDPMGGRRPDLYSALYR